MNQKQKQNYTTISFVFVFYYISCAHKGCIYLIKYRKEENHFEKHYNLQQSFSNYYLLVLFVIYFCEGKAEFSAVFCVT